MTTCDVPVEGAVALVCGEPVVPLIDGRSGCPIHSRGIPADMADWPVPEQDEAAPVYYAYNAAGRRVRVTIPQD